MKFEEKIKKLRTENNMTQDELAEKLFVTRTAVSKWETGQGFPSIESLKLISKMFDISIDSLISDEDIETTKMLDKKRSRKFYWAAIAFLVLTYAASLTVYFTHIKQLNYISILGTVGFVVCALYGKPKHKKVEYKKYLITYIISRMVMLIIVAGLIVYTIFKM